VLRALLLILLLAVATFGVALAVDTQTMPTLGFKDTVPDDLRSLASETWQDLLDAHPAVANCIGSATLAAAWELDNRAEYQPDSAMIVIRVPGTAPNLRSQMVHEFAHHIEFTCPEQGELRSAFTHAQGFSGSTEWFDGETWETTPSEQYAEATVELVLGRRPHHGNIQISAQAADIVRRWASDS
jgi:hypothetical protein